MKKKLKTYEEQDRLIILLGWIIYVIMFIYCSYTSNK